MADPLELLPDEPEEDLEELDDPAGQEAALLDEPFEDLRLEPPIAGRSRPSRRPQRPSADEVDALGAASAASWPLGAQAAEGRQRSTSSRRPPIAGTGTAGGPLAAPAAWSRVASDRHLQELVQARLFGGEPSRSSSPCPAPSPQLRGRSDPSARARLVSPRAAPLAGAEPFMTPEHTFRPTINENSRHISRTSSQNQQGPRWLALSKQASASPRRSKSTQMLLMQEQEEARECTFQPQVNEASSLICQRQRGKLKRWNTFLARGSCSPSAFASTENVDSAFTSTENVGSAFTSIENLDSAFTSTDKPESLRSGKGTEPRTPRSARRGTRSPARGSPVPRSGHRAIAQTGLTQSTLGVGDPVFKDLHRMLRSLKL